MSYYFVKQYNLPDAAFQMVALNNLGDVLGYYAFPGGAKQTFMIKNNGEWVLLDIGDPIGINDNRQLVGSSHLYDYGSGTLTELMPNIVAEGITNYGMIFGSEDDYYACYQNWGDPTPSLVPGLGISVAYGGDDDGDVIIVGSSEAHRPFIYRSGDANPIFLESTYVAAKDINAQKIVIGGYSQTEGGSITQHGFICDQEGNITQELGFNALAISGPISSSGSEFQVVGVDSDEDAVLMDKNGDDYRNYNLNDCVSPDIIDAGWRLCRSIDVNDQGQIIAEAKLDGVDKGSFLLTPAPPEINVRSSTSSAPTGLKII